MKQQFHRLFPAVILTFFGIVIFQIGYEMLRRGSITYAPEGVPADVLSPHHRAAEFWAISAGTLSVGVLLFIVAAFLLFTFIRGKALGIPNRLSSAWVALMKRIGLDRLGPILNLVLLLLSFGTGYAEMAPERLARANPDAIFCTVTLLGMIGFSFGTVAYSISGADQQTLRRPSLRRFSINWSRDPLQCLFLSCAFTGSMGLGAAFRVPGTSTTGFWMFMFFLCLFLGLLIGQLGVYIVHRERIVTSNKSLEPTAGRRDAHV